MYSIFKKEMRSFFGSFIAYISISFFLILIGSLMWLLPGTNILYQGYASLFILFNYGPYFLIILSSAITMGFWSSEKKTGMLDILFTSPISTYEIIIGKYLSSIVIVVVALFLTLVYYITVYLLGNPIGNIDTPGIVTSYLGLIMLTSVFLSIGIFVSSLNNNQIVAFLVSLIVCIVYYQGFELISRLHFLNKISLTIANLGGIYHFNSLSKGVIDTRDIIYFLSISILMISLTKINLSKSK